MTSTDLQVKALNDLLGDDFGTALGQIFGQLEWAEEEIDRAMRRHRASADTIYHSFSLLTPSHDRMSAEQVYRAHCRELLDRVAAGQDTRPGTAAEACCALSDASFLAPLTTTAAGLYGRLFGRVFPGQSPWDGQSEHYEALRGAQIDDLESETRRKTAVTDRRLGAIECCGMHHGEEVQCSYAARVVQATAERVPGMAGAIQGSMF